MIEYTKGNLLEADCEAIVNPVNTVGVMGKGLAKQFKIKFPDNFKAYETACNTGRLVTGKVFIFETGQLFNPKYIVNFPTKIHWRNPSRIDYILRGMESLSSEILRRKIQSIAVPALGCGLGGLDWIRVKSVLEHHFNAMEVYALVFEPNIVTEY